jgi:broad specificity phosphatase PhoE
VPLLRDRDIHLIYASDLLRAVQTAEYLRDGLGLPLVLHAELREISFGEWEGQRWSELKATPLGAQLQSFESSLDGSAPGGESFLRFRERAVKALKNIASQSDNRTTAVVTHMGVIRVALRHLAEVDDTILGQKIDPCGIYRFALSGGAFEYMGQLTTACGASQSSQHP